MSPIPNSSYPDVINFFKEYSKVFTTLFIVLIGLTYFFQGFRSYSTGGAVGWFLRSLKLQSGAVQQARSTVLISFNIKFVYGLLFDNVPLFKRNYQPWYFVSAFIGLVSFILLGIPGVVTSEGSAVGLLFLAVVSQAMTDTIADGMVVKNARMAGAAGGAGLQTFCWIMLFTGRLIGDPTSGAINGKGGTGTRTLMLYVFAPCSLVLVIVSFFFKEPTHDRKFNPTGIIWTIWRLIKGILLNTKVLLPMIWIFLQGALVPDIEDAYNFWLVDRPGGGLVIGADTQAYVGAMGSALSIVGLLVFAKWFTRTPFRTFFFWIQIVIGLLGLFDVALYKGWNRNIKIDDLTFYVFGSALGSIIGRFSSMPFLIMAAQMCPQDIEATFYATLTSISNAGANVSTRWGGVLLSALDVDIVDPVSGEVTWDVVNLEKAIWIRFGMVFVPCLLVFLMPNVSAINPHHDDAASDDGMTAAERDELEAAAAHGDDQANIELKKQDEKVAEEQHVTGLVATH
ncbi:hypothetical protein HDV05_000401 [Chytridiales sp. JEL 0842]|nr:hypothetical protein HDV05_000401 [Chytridiales sp. JEL 0842]